MMVVGPPHRHHTLGTHLGLDHLASVRPAARPCDSLLLHHSFPPATDPAARCSNPRTHCCCLGRARCPRCPRRPLIAAAPAQQHGRACSPPRARPVPAAGAGRDAARRVHGPPAPSPAAPAQGCAGRLVQAAAPPGAERRGVAGAGHWALLRGAVHACVPGSAWAEGSGGQARQPA